MLRCYLNIIQKIWSLLLENNYVLRHIGMWMIQGGDVSDASSIYRNSLCTKLCRGKTFIGSVPVTVIATRKRASTVVLVVEKRTRDS